MTTVQTALRCALPVVACVFLLAFGVLGYGRGASFGEGMGDMLYLYAAGEIWSQGASPYELELFSQFGRTNLHVRFLTFAYAPQTAPIALLLSAGSPETAKVLMTLLNLGCVATLAWLAIRMLSEAMGDAPRSELQAAAAVTAAVIIGNPFTAHILWMGQTSLIAAAAAVGAYYATYRDREVVAGVLLGLSTFKPHLSVFFVLWLLLDRRFKVVAIGAASALACAAVPMLTAGVAPTWFGWYHSLTAYTHDSVTGVTFRHTFGVRSLLALWDLGVPGLALVGAALVGLLYRQRDKAGAWVVPGVLFSMSALFIYAHDYDLAAVSVLAAPLAWFTKRQLNLRVGALALAFVLYFPQRIWRHFDLTDVGRSREVALLVLTLLAVSLSMRWITSPSHERRLQPSPSR